MWNAPPSYRSRNARTLPLVSRSRSVSRHADRRLIQVSLNWTKFIFFQGPSVASPCPATVTERVREIIRPSVVVLHYVGNCPARLVVVQGQWHRAVVVGHDGLCDLVVGQPLGVVLLLKVLIFIVSNRPI